MVTIALLEIRKKRGLSQNNLAVKSGLSPNSIRRIEGNEATSIPVATMDKLCKALNCEPGDLYHYDPSLPQEEEEKSTRGKEKG
ncbi:MAG: helix-turn-helix transcriptional regulator [Symploca sp. SIO2E9]|nr:helix-turn-helix transcriptional regulator [Symploca sp. SIO2E9]